MLEQLQSGVAQTVILPMEYRAVMKDGSAPARPQEDAPSPSTVQELEARIRELEQEIEQQRGRFETEVESARIEAREEGRAKERSERATRIEAAAQRMAETLAEFAAERDRYLAQVEQEVVRLGTGHSRANSASRGSNGSIASCRRGSRCAGTTCG